MRRIVYLFKKCLAKFKKDKNIWLEFFNFLIKHKCTNILNKEIGFCLANHPNTLDFWKIAAYNEYENNLNTFVARNLFQKCLRMNKDNLQAYLEYYIFEIKFVEKILERRKILSQAENNDENKLKFLNDVNEAEKNIKEEIENASITDDVLNLKICEIVWRKALNAKLIDENKISLTLKFLKVLYQEKNRLGSNMKNLKNIMIQYIKELPEELIKFNLKIKKENEISDCDKNIPTDNTINQMNDNDDYNLLSIEIFLIKLEKVYYMDKTEKETDKLRVKNFYYKLSFK